VIKIESIAINEMRGIRSLPLTLGGDSFVISGPNGSGKSGVVDAIQFALTGEMGRLKGAGTADITLAAHGPHVEKRDDPAAASVTLNVFIPHLGKSASITRTIRQARTPQISPDDADIIAVFADLAEHGEVTLSRREIIKFILTEAAKRSRDVQTLLKLDAIDEIRATLKTAANKLDAAQTQAKSVADSAGDSLRRHLDLPALGAEDVLAAINNRRAVLGLTPVGMLAKDTDVTTGLGQSQDGSGTGQSKESVLADLSGVLNLVDAGLEVPTSAAVSALQKDFASIDADPNLLGRIKQQPFLQEGLNLVEGPQCPLCDTSWDIEVLQAHLKEKLQKSAQAEATRNQIVANGEIIAQEAIRLREQFVFVRKLPEVGGVLAEQIQMWGKDLSSLAEGLRSFDGSMAARSRLEAGWARPPATLANDLSELHAKVKARPDRSATEQARSFLVIAQERLATLRRALRDLEEKRVNAARGRSAYKAYCDISDRALASLYEQVEEEFASFYRLINHDDEGEFRAELSPADGSLDLRVDFHKKGMFPPGAYHSEGHQDGMGLCLYLALMKRVLGDGFTFAVLDDVVMSVDAQHRKQFCKLLRTHFPNTQFIITTHDQVWARQIRSEGLIGAKAAVAFHHWTVETGPVLDEVAEIWEQIDADLLRNEVPIAAARLRRHLECVAADLADELGARVKFRADGGYDMGELLSAVIARQGELLRKASKVARSWGDDDQVKNVEKLQEARTAILKEKGGEEWVINKAVHYNEWANLSCNDFKPVVGVFRDLLQQFRCSKPNCDSWLSVTPRHEPVDLRCACGSLRFNLKEK